MYVPPIIAVAFNLGTLAFVYWHKYKRGLMQLRYRNHETVSESRVSSAKSREELLVTLGLLAQSIVPAVTLSSRAYFMWIEVFREFYCPD